MYTYIMTNMPERKRRFMPTKKWEAGGSPGQLVEREAARAVLCDYLAPWKDGNRWKIPAEGTSKVYSHLRCHLILMILSSCFLLAGGQYVGRHFTKTDIYAAIFLRGTIGNETQRLFKADRLGWHPEIQSWLMDPKDANLIDKYGRLTRAQFLDRFDLENQAQPKQKVSAVTESMLSTSTGSCVILF